MFEQEEYGSRGLATARCRYVQKANARRRYSIQPCVKFNEVWMKWVTGSGTGNSGPEQGRVFSTERRRHRE